MLSRKILNLLVLVSMLASLLLMGGVSPASAQKTQSPLAAANSSVMAKPGSPTDETKVPHYFGPYPNYANSPQTHADAIVTITGGGSGATATATVDPATGSVTAVNVTTPGGGYAAASTTVTISGSGTSAQATATVSTSGVVTAITVGNPGSGYTKPVVTISGGGATGTPVLVGNSLVARAFATDYATPPGALGPVFVVVPTTMPTNGLVKGIQYFNQATTGGSPTPSAGNLFHAYVLHPTANPNEYSVLWDSGEQTVPAAVDPVGDIVTILVPDVAVTTGDRIAFYGEGIPLDDLGTGADTLSYPAPTPPTQGGTITLGGAGFPVYSQTRTYSFAANVLDMSAVPPVVNATATAFGGVDAVTVITTGSGYSMPTVDFDLPDDPNGVQARGYVVCVGDPVGGPYCNITPPNTTVTIQRVVVTEAGSGYLSTPNVVIRDGTLFNPINGGAGATAAATLKVTSIRLDTFGSGYVSAPAVAIADSLGGTGTGATATATTDVGGITVVTVTNGGSGYLTSGLKKFIDPLPGLCDPAGCPASGKYIPLGVPDTTSYANSDTYEIGLVQYRMQFSSQLPPTLVRGYVQLETPANAAISKHFPLVNEVLNGQPVPVLVGGVQAYGVTSPQYLGPTIVATKDKAVRIIFRNLLPKDMGGNLFIPVDSTIMGSGMGPLASQTPPVDAGSVMDDVRNPMCTEGYMNMMPGPEQGCFPQNRATLHLHGGVTPWISDGTPHQWITPASEDTAYPQGVSVQNVPDMNVCGADNDGCQTFFYTNQQSARLMFYHDHAWGITRLNVYAGEAAGYLITDATEQKLMAPGGALAGLGYGIPLVIQDKTFVPSPAALAKQDPTWDTTRWGGMGSLWMPHVYMPAQNPGDPSGMSSFGRWMYGPWFWPPATNVPYQPIANPYYKPTCDLNVPATWQYQTDPFCEPALIPGTPNITVGMEAFNDTPLVNGTAYPTVTLEPKSYRLRVLNAANDRFWNLQWYVGDPTTANPQTGATEVALKAAEVAAAQTDPVVFPTPDTLVSPPGPSWIQIGTEGGFLPAPVVVPNQPTTWITDPTRFDVGNVDLHSLLLAPAERADVIVDFSAFAGKTLILYNDAPAAFPARVPGYDYYTGGPDLSPVGAPTTLPGYGPNTRTIMQVKIAGTPAPTFNLTALQNAFKHQANGSGVFESGQHPIIVGQAAYNSAYGTNFAAAGWCNAPGSTSTRCDGYARIQEQGGFQFGFNTLLGQNAKMTIPLQPKGIHDEMNSTSFDEYGRMQATIGLEAPGATPLLQNIILYPYVNPSSEIIDATNLPKGDVGVKPISSATDGTQIWKITHNGVDTHPLHFHLYDVQILNRVTWDNIIIPPDATELGWKDTIRVSPLEDTIVALRPIIPTLPFDVPNSIRYLNPMMPPHSTLMFNPTDANGNPTAPITNELTNFGWEYVWHCHILSHEEMDMMRPVSVAIPPKAPTNLVGTVTGSGNNQRVVLTWTDNSATETGFTIRRGLTATGPWTSLATVAANVTTYTDPIGNTKVVSYYYQVMAANTVGYTGTPGYSTLTVTGASNVVLVGLAPQVPPAAPTGLTAVVQAGPQVLLTWTDNATDETGFVIQRATNGGAFSDLITVGPRNNTGSVSYTDVGVVAGNTYTYQVAALNAAGRSAYSNIASAVIVAPPAAPTNVNATARLQGNNARVTLTWTDVATNETGYRIQRATNAAFTANLVTSTVGANITTFTTGNVTRNTPFYFRVQAFNGAGPSAWVNANPSPILTP